MLESRRSVAGLGVALAGLVAVVALALSPALFAQADTAASIPRMKMDEFKKRLAAGDIIVIDNRGDEAFRDGHIPGAISVPLSSVAGRAGMYKGSKKPLVLYCA